MSDEELKQMVQHLAKLHGVTPEHIVAEALGEEPAGAHHGMAAGAHGATIGHESAEAAGLESEAGSVGLEADLGDEADEEPAGSRRGRRAGWIAAMVVMGALVGFVVIGVIRFFNAPAAAAIKPALDGVPAASPQPTGPTTNLLAGLDMSLSYPGIFNQVTHVKNDPSASEQYDIGSKGDYHRLITVEVRSLPSGDLSDESSYRVRQLNPTQYKGSTEQIGGQPVTFMTNTNGQEQVMFWIHKTEVLVVAVTSTDPADKVASFMDVIKSSVKWKS